MAKKRRRSGHYCIVCGSRKANEKFSGKGHARHICKKCSKKSPEEQQERIDINRIHNLCRYSNLSKNNKKMLNEFLKDERGAVRKAAEEIEEMFFPKYEEPEWLEAEEVETIDDDDWGFFDPDLEEEELASSEDFDEIDFSEGYDIPF